MNSKYEIGVSGFLFERKVKFVMDRKPAGENTQAGALVFYICLGMKRWNTNNSGIAVE